MPSAGASRNHSHNKGMWSLCKHVFAPQKEALKASDSISLSTTPSRAAYHGPDLVCPGRILLRFPRGAQKRPCLSPEAQSQESAGVKLGRSRRCPTFKLHSSPWDCFWALTKGERACVWVSKGVCAYVHLGCTGMPAFLRARPCSQIGVYVCVCAREGRA